MSQNWVKVWVKEGKFEPLYRQFSLWNKVIRAPILSPFFALRHKNWSNLATLLGTRNSLAFLLSGHEKAASWLETCHVFSPIFASILSSHFAHANLSQSRFAKMPHRYTVTHTDIIALENYLQQPPIWRNLHLLYIQDEKILNTDACMKNRTFFRVILCFISAF